MSTIYADDMIPVSALQHYTYCPRQCGLIFVEKVFEHNLFTMRGKRAHKFVEDPVTTRVGENHVERALPIWSEELGLIGVADWVEFLEDGTPYPVEQKVGPRKVKRPDDIQLCAQGLCLEEMFRLPVTSGAIYHHSSRHRRVVKFDDTLRREVRAAARRVRGLIEFSLVPQPVADDRCPKCSLVSFCAPEVYVGNVEWMG